MAANSKALEPMSDPHVATAESTRTRVGVKQISPVALLAHRRATITELVPASLRHDMITLAAYYRSAERNFAPGYELEDWLAAEREVDATLRARYTY